MGSPEPLPPAKALRPGRSSLTQHNSTVQIQRPTKTYMARFYEQLVAALAGNQPFVLALISGTKGSSPQRIGAKALFFPDGKIIGTLGGGCLEAEVHARARKTMKSGQPATFEMVLDHNFGWDDGLICGGSVSGLILPRAAEAAALWRQLAAVTAPVRWGVKKDFSIALVGGRAGSPLPAAGAQTSDGAHGVTRPTSQWLYQETVAPPSDLWIAGSGHVAQAVAPLALKLDFAVTVFDDRPELANHQFFPPDVRLQVGGWHELLKVPLPESPAFGLIVTRGHQHDALVLSEWINLPFVFLGMIGSRRKARIMREQFLKQKIATAEQFDKIACPVGVDIRAQSTQEIGVSIMAQYIQKRAEFAGVKR
jgi:xanthine dehydrogenase accessory factor